MIAWIALAAAHGSTFAEVPTIDVLTERSAAVVEGVVTVTDSVPCALGLCTTYTVSVSETWRGPEHELVRVTLPGGKRGGLTQRVAGLPLWSVGDEVLLFLDHLGRPTWTSVFTIQRSVDPPEGSRAIVFRELADPVGRRHLTSVQELHAQVIGAETTRP
ncbi:MAG: hypothetical protein AAF602_00400 [Myxococcota bacterium]